MYVKKIKEQHKCKFPKWIDLFKEKLVKGTIWKCDFCQVQYVYAGQSFDSWVESMWVKIEDWNFEKNKHNWFARKYFG